MMRTLRVWVVVLLLLPLSPGCGGDSAGLPGGELQIPWRVATSSCDLLGVDTVAVFLTGGGQTATDLHSFNCGDGEGEITDLEPGNYNISLRGRDELGVDRFGAERDNVQVRAGGTTTLGTVTLSALPASITVSWFFENGRLCAFNQVEAVEISLFKDEYLISTASAPCGDGTLELTDVLADGYIVDVVARDDDEQITFNGQEAVTVDRGDVTSVEVRLAPVESGGPGG